MPTDSISFAANFAQIASAFYYPKHGGLLITLDIPECDVMRSMRLRVWRDRLCTFTFAPADIKKIKHPAISEEGEVLEAITIRCTPQRPARSGKEEGVRVRLFIDDADLAAALPLELWCGAELKVTAELIINHDRTKEETSSEEESSETAPETVEAVNAAGRACRSATAGRYTPRR